MYHFAYALLVLACHPDYMKQHYEFLPGQVKRSVTVNDLYYSGHIDASGSFAQGLATPIRLPAVISFHLPDYYASSGKEQVYQYKEGRLVPGVLNKGAFTRDEKLSELDFDDYALTLYSRRIFNLPGTWVYKQRR